MRLNVRPKAIAQSVLYYSTLLVLAMPWGSHSQWFGYGMTVRIALIVMVAAAYMLTGRGCCRS
jgi:hypothetical protein